MELRVRVSRYIALFVVSLCFALSGRAQGQVAQSYAFYRGVSQVLMEDNQGAYNTLTQLLEYNPTHAPSHYYLAKVYINVGEYKSAFEHVAKAAAIDPENPLYLELYGRMQIDTGDYQGALATLTKARLADPQKREHYIMELALLTELGRYDEALALSSQYEERFGLDDDFIAQYAGVYIAKQDYFSLLMFRERVRATNPDNIIYILSLAEVQAAMGNTAEALKLYKRALEIEPNSVEVYSALANYHRVMGEIDKYIEALVPIFQNSDIAPTEKISTFREDFMVPDHYNLHFMRIRNLISAMILAHPSDTQVNKLYGEYLIYIGELDAAEAQYASMVESGDYTTEPYQTLFEIKMFREKYDDAIAVADRAISKFNDLTFMQNRVVALWLKGDSKTALRELDGVIRKSPSDSLSSALYGLKGDIYHEEGNNNKAFTAYRKALKFDPNNTLVLNNFAYYLALEDRQLDYALEMANRANQLSPDNATYLDSEAWVLYMMGRYRDAQLLMSRVMELDDEPSGDVLMHYGDILYALGDDFIARDYWKRAAKAGADPAEVESRLELEKAVRPTTTE